MYLKGIFDVAVVGNLAIHLKQYGCALHIFRVRLATMSINWR